MYADFGLNHLAEKSLHEFEHERLHARDLIQRILFLEGTPNLVKREALTARSTVPKILNALGKKVRIELESV